jgi:protein-tyrosine phosphatase
MIDLHCHFLPNIDDGPESLVESLDLARFALENGITKSVMTPLIHPGRYENSHLDIQLAVQKFEVALARQGIPLDLSIGAEVRIGADTIYMVAQEEVPFLGELGGYKILLLEFPHETIPVGSINLVQWLMAKDIRPMIAHPERNKDVMRDLSKIEPFINEGCLMQLTAASIAGNFGKQAEMVSRQMLENDWVYVIATDAHNIDHRPPDLAVGRDAAAEIVGLEKANLFVDDHPRTILQGE